MRASLSEARASKADRGGFVEAELLREVGKAVRFDLVRVGWRGRHGCELKNCSHLTIL
jgi:hypothetical protein